MGIDIHIISFIVKGMEDSELAYQIYSCMTTPSNGRVFQYDEEEEIVKKKDYPPFHQEELILPKITFGENLKGILHYEVDLSAYFTSH